MELPLESLHPSLASPVLGAIPFLNEVMSRYPDAISFAPGAPHTRYVAETDLERSVVRWLTHARGAWGLSEDGARQLLYEYGPTAGLINDLIADALCAALGTKTTPDDVVVTVGAQEAFLITLRALFRSPGDLLAVVNPSFVGIMGAAELLGIEMVPVDEGESGVDVDRLDAECDAAEATGRRIRALYVAPDHSNPSGTVMPREARHRLVDLAARRELLLIEDNAYGFTTAPGAELPTLKSLAPQRVLFIGTFAKLCLPGTRVGFVVAGQRVRSDDGAEHRLAADLAAVKSMVTVNTSPICQAVVGGMLLEHGGSFAALGQRKSELYRQNLQLLLGALDEHLSHGPGHSPKVVWNRPQGGFFVRMRLPVSANESLLKESASRYGVLWTPMSPFYLGGRGRNEIRLSCSYLDAEEIEEGTHRLARFIGSI
ncbi:PLP-dependent aminotransferase family protein [Streptomyces sp. ALI-76-A]|uniref:aminotransferase-like domain-containing protein n=1 Tax=Streptomyces sp. ALI-76-A TaxID=3025736 RepID=UPI00256F1284|nr:PLP-dependent aminotransferase family protein [Streptomyces sp. ALI-76-A]MDL5199791.1 PLP-dependent aminotransferase family protein [Streptomyces sp. ALI-76-A]